MSEINYYRCVLNLDNSLLQLFSFIVARSALSLFPIPVVHLPFFHFLIDETVPEQQQEYVTCWHRGLCYMWSACSYLTQRVPTACWTCPQMAAEVRL